MILRSYLFQGFRAGVFFHFSVKGQRVSIYALKATESLFQLCNSASKYNISCRQYANEWVWLWVPMKLIYKNRYHACLTHEPWIANPRSRECCWKDWELPCYSKLCLLGVLFGTENTWETADAGRLLWPPPFYPKADHKISYEKGTISVPVREEHSHYWSLGMNLYKPIY